jgi:ribosomal protein S18 acetylase RimI-like enzyme
VQSSSIEVRAALATDAQFIAEMLAQAVFWRPEQAQGTVQDVLSTPELAHYIDGWPRPGDIGVIASDKGQPVGAAWLRTMPASDPGYGFVDESIPELGMGVLASARGVGVGSRLLAAIIDAARSREITAISLSVERDNAAARRLYNRFGFQPVDEVGGSFTMMLALPRASGEGAGNG